MITIGMAGPKPGTSLAVSVTQGGVTAGPYSVTAWGGVVTGYRREITPTLLPIAETNVDVSGGRVTEFEVETVKDIAAVEITSQPAHGFVTVQPDNTLALVLSGSTYSGALAFTARVTHADQTTLDRDANLTVAAVEQYDGWGLGKHYMLETDAEGDLVIETGDNHRKVYASGSETALTAADIAALESVSEGTVTGSWLKNNYPEYGATEGMALEPSLARSLFVSLTPTPTVASHWLLFERGYTYSGLVNPVSRDVSGESPIHPIYVGAWGTGARPTISDKWSFTGTVDNHHIVFDGLSFAGGFSAFVNDNLMFNDCEIVDRDADFTFPGRLTIRNSLIHHTTAEPPPPPATTWSGGHVQGIYATHVNGLLMENNIWHHCGWGDGYDYYRSNLYPRPVDSYCHNIYLQNTTRDVTCRNSILSQGASVGSQFRGGAFVEDNIFVDNNIGLNFNGGAYTFGDPPAGNFSFISDNVITSAGHKTWNTDPSYGEGTYSAPGALSWGMTSHAYGNVLLDNIIAHLADPDDPADFASKTIIGPAQTFLVTPTFDNTVIYNWVGNGDNDDGTVNNTPSLDTDSADQTTIQRYAAQVMGGTPTIANLMDAILAGTVSVGARDIIDYFQAGFGIAPSGSGNATSHRFMPNALAEGVRWDNRVNWSHEELPTAGDHVDLGGNRVQFGGTLTTGDLDLGGGHLTINYGKLTMGGTLTGPGTIRTEISGQLWLAGYAGTDALTVETTSGRVAFTGNVSGPMSLTASGGQTILATDGTAFTLASGQVLTVSGSTAKVGVDGDAAGTATLTLIGALDFVADAAGVSTVKKFRSGAWDQVGSPVTSAVALSGPVSVDLTAYTGGAGSIDLIDVDSLTGTASSMTVTGGSGSIARVGNKLVLTVS